ncbi:MAG: anthranilate phosphoribosyltransferase [Gemmatimonadota bacterium]
MVSSETPALSAALAKLAARCDLTAAEAEAAFVEVMEGKGDDAQKSGLLMGLRGKGETAAEVAGGVRALRRAVIAVASSDPDRLVDTAGTGGGSGITTFNISTAAAFVVAGGGVPVAKHGNRSHTSRCGSADVLEALGVKIDISPEKMSSILERVGLTFMYAPALHPAMRHIGPVRRALGVPTVMNVLGPLTNPAGARRQVVGVSHPALLPLVAGALADLGHIRALVVHGEPGMDELSPAGHTDVVSVEAGSIEETRFDPAAELGWTDIDLGDLIGGEPEDNARVIEEILAGAGKRGGRAAVILNAAAGLVVGGVVGTIPDGVEMAESIISEGKGLAVLEALREASASGD